MALKLQQGARTEAASRAMREMHQLEQMSTMAVGDSETTPAKVGALQKLVADKNREITSLTAERDEASKRYIVQCDLLDDYKRKESMFRQVLSHDAITRLSELIIDTAIYR